MAFQAIVARENDGEVAAGFECVNFADLPSAPVLVKVSHSALNYKDALAVCGNRNKIMKTLPFVPGIDLAGTVVESTSSGYAPGDQVFITGWGLGERHWGGFSQYARVKPEWLLHVPLGLDRERTMAIGTAGLTAMLCVEALEECGVRPLAGEVLVTGASGGVGSLAVMLLAALGYNVTVSTGRPEQSPYFKSLGAKRVVPRADLDRVPRPLEKEVFAGVVDTVGSKTLASALAQTRYGGVVAACGLAGGYDLPATVMPFILRNIRLQGVDSVHLSNVRRVAAWKRLAQLLSTESLNSIVQKAKLADIPELARRMIAGEARGRTVITLDGPP